MTTAGSDAKSDFTINGKKVSLDKATTAADIDAAVASVNEQLGENSKFEAAKERAESLQSAPARMTLVRSPSAARTQLCSASWPTA